ncbi:MAG TPA: hypothetical protein VF054_02530 [Micromonosporaceae bacterium]
MKWRMWGTILVVLAVAWALFGFELTKPTDFHDYRITAVESAQSAYDALVTAKATGEAQLAGRTFDTYVESNLDDANKALAGAQKDFVGTAPVDARTTAMRDELGPLLAASTRALTNLQKAEQTHDDAGLRAALAAIDPIASRLSDFIDRHQ